MPVTTRSRDRSSITRESMEPEATVMEPSHSGLSTVEDTALNSRNEVRVISYIGNGLTSNRRDATDLVSRVKS